MPDAVVALAALQAGTIGPRSLALLWTRRRRLIFSGKQANSGCAGASYALALKYSRVDGAVNGGEADAVRLFWRAPRGGNIMSE